MTKTTRRTLLQGAGALAGTAFLPGALAQIIPVQPNPGQPAIQPVPIPPPGPPVPAGPVAPPGAGFLQAGVRLTYLQAAAALSIPISSLVPDAKGRWKDARSGAVIGNGSSGAGFVAVDVMKLSAAGILCWNTVYGLNDPPNTTTVMIDALGALVPGAGQSDAWLPPAQLAAMTPSETAEMKVSRDELDTADRKFQTVTVQSFAQGAWSQMIYDVETGLVISSGVATRLPQGTNLAITRLAAIRTPASPGPGAAYPAAISGLKSLVYTGDYGQAVTGASVMPPWPLEVKYDVTASDPSYMLTKRTVTLNGQVVSQGDLLMPAGMPGSFWMDPAWLAARTAGETLDVDPVTGATVKSAGVYGGLTVIAITTAASTVYVGYDPVSGLMKAAEGADVNGPGTTTRRLNLKSAA